MELVSAYSQSGSVHRAWVATAVPVALSTVWRWIRRWNHSASHIRSRLFGIHPPPENSPMSTSQFTLGYLQAALPAELCPASAFQARFQQSFVL